MHRIDEPLPEQWLQNKPFTVMNNHLRAALQLLRKRCNFSLAGLGVFQLLGVIIFPKNYDNNVPRCFLERHVGWIEARNPLMGTPLQPSPEPPHTFPDFSLGKIPSAALYLYVSELIAVNCG